LGDTLEHKLEQGGRADSAGTTDNSDLHGVSLDGDWCQAILEGLMLLADLGG
jgi:hypothetical protein